MAAAPRSRPGTGTVRRRVGRLWRCSPAPRAAPLTCGAFWSCSSAEAGRPDRSRQGTGRAPQSRRPSGSVDGRYRVYPEIAVSGPRPAEQAHRKSASRLGFVLTLSAGCSCSIVANLLAATSGLKVQLALANVALGDDFSGAAIRRNPAPDTVGRRPCDRRPLAQAGYIGPSAELATVPIGSSSLLKVSTAECTPSDPMADCQ